MSAGHTPGPWSYRPQEHDDWGIVRAPNTQGYFAGGIICQAYDPEARDELTLAKHREARTDPWEANARVIAAAPELLTELEEAVFAIETGQLSGAGAFDLANKFRAAIAKARAQ